MLAGQFIGRMGYLNVFLPYWSVLTYLILLVTLAATDARAVVLHWKQKVLLAAIVAGSFLGMCVLLWSFDATSYLSSQMVSGGGFVPGLQGRYFISFAFPALMLLSTQRFRIATERLIIPVFVIIAVVNLSAASAIWKAYYSPSQARLAQGSPERPIFGSIDQPLDSAVVSRTCTVSGWAITSGASVSKVQIDIDGQLRMEAATGSPRPDVAAVFPDEASAPKSGFALTLNLNQFAPGDHRLTVTARSSLGDTGTIGNVWIHVEK